MLATTYKFSTAENHTFPWCFIKPVHSTSLILNITATFFSRCWKLMGVIIILHWLQAKVFNWYWPTFININFGKTLKFFFFFFFFFFLRRNMIDVLFIVKGTMMFNTRNKKQKTKNKKRKKKKNPKMLQNNLSHEEKLRQNPVAKDFWPL